MKYNTIKAAPIYEEAQKDLHPINSISLQTKKGPIYLAKSHLAPPSVKGMACIHKWRASPHFQAELSSDK